MVEELANQTQRLPESQEQGWGGEWARRAPGFTSRTRLTNTRCSREAPQCTPSAVSFPGTSTTVLQPLEKARPETKAPSKDSVQGLRACCLHTEPTSDPVISGFVTGPGPEHSRPSGGCQGYGGPFSSPPKMTHSQPQEGMSLQRHKKE